MDSIMTIFLFSLLVVQSCTNTIVIHHDIADVKTKCYLTQEEGKGL